MFGSEILETAIGVIFLFTFLSLFVSVIKEMIEAFSQKRARDLFEEIKQIVEKGGPVPLSVEEARAAVDEAATAFDVAQTKYTAAAEAGCECCWR